MMNDFSGRYLPDYQVTGSKQAGFSPYADNGG